MRGHQIGEILDQLALAERVDLCEILADAPHGARCRPLLQVQLVLTLEMLRKGCHDGKSSSSESRLRIKCVNLHLARQPSGFCLLRVAASSNTETDSEHAIASMFAALT